jgi:hypothetical protein
LNAVPVKERVILTGGDNGGTCGGPHLFTGLDTEFVAATAGFMRKYNRTVVGLPQTTSVKMPFDPHFPVHTDHIGVPDAAGARSSPRHAPTHSFNVYQAP